MSKYQKLESVADATDATYAATTDDDECFAPFMDSNATTTNNNSKNSKHANNINNYNNNNNNVDINQSGQHCVNYDHSYTQIALDADAEHTMDVPLLLSNNNNNNNNYDYEQQIACRCNQPGFAANLTNKSTQDAKFKIILAASLCGVFMFIEFLGGYLAGSLAIMSDAAHLATDCISFVIGLVAISLGSKPPNAGMSFGYKRGEVLGVLISILSIWILTVMLVFAAIKRLCTNDYDLDAKTMMIASLIGIVINIVMLGTLHGSTVLPAGAVGGHGHSHAHAHAHGHSHNHAIGNGHGAGHGHGHGQEEHAHNNNIHAHSHVPQQTVDDAHTTLIVDGNGNGLMPHTPNGAAISPERNMNLRAAVVHVIGDLVQSIGVFLASVFIKFYPQAKFVDPLCTLFFSVIVIMTTVRLFRDSANILMNAVPHAISLEQLKSDLLHIEGVYSVHHLHVWSHTADYSVLMVHLVIDLLSDSNLVLEQATQLAQCAKYNIGHCTIQIERSMPS